MPSIASIVTRFAKQTILYWEKIGTDGFNRPIYKDPVELACRWEDKQQEMILPDSRKVLSKGYILLTTKLLPGSLVFLGNDQGTPQADWANLPGYPNPPTVGQGGREVLITHTTPDIKAISRIYESYL